MMKWVYCSNCRHKLFLVDMASTARFEVKCHSCKAVDFVSVSNGKIKAIVKEEKNKPNPEIAGK